MIATNIFKSSSAKDLIVMMKVLTIYELFTVSRVGGHDSLNDRLLIMGSDISLLV